MNSVLEQQLRKLQASGTDLHLKGVLHGIEKEGLRVNSSGSLSKNMHPLQLGSPLTNGSVTTDFSEALLELITPVFTAPKEAIEFLENVHQFTYSHLGDELMWASSMPCHIADPTSIPIAQFGSSNVGKMKHIYRVGLSHRYGKIMQSIAGIHYNFSLSGDFWKAFQASQNNQDTLQTFRSASYFKMIRNFRRHSWLLLYLFGASPALSKSFLSGKSHNLKSLYNNTLYLPHATSLRMSDLGYSTTAQSSLNICFNHLKTYLKSLSGAVRTPYPAYEKIGVKVDGSYRQLAATVLQIENEYYSDVRPKRIAEGDETPLQALSNRGVEYIEVRNSDINPFLLVGIDLQQAQFLDIFLISCLLLGDEILCPAECKIASNNVKKVTTRGREPGLKLSNPKGKIALEDAGTELLEQMDKTASLLDQLHKTNSYSLSVKAQFAKLQDSSLTPSSKVLTSLQESGLEYAEWILEKSKEHKETFRQKSPDANTFKHLSQQAKDSVIEQKQIEEGDTMGFDQFLAMYRTGLPE